MPKVTAAIAALVLAITLTGCTTAQTPTQEPASAPQSAEQSPESTPAPLVAETPAESDPASDVEVAFVEKFHEIRATMPGASQIPDATDEQLIAAGEEACTRLSGGETSDTIVLIEGEAKNGAGYYSDSGAVISSARQTLCPEHING